MFHPAQNLRKGHVILSLSKDGPAIIGGDSVLRQTQDDKVARAAIVENGPARLALLCLAILVFSGATSGSARNFTWWQNASAHDRQFAVSEAIEGLRYGWETGYDQGRGEAVEAFRKNVKSGNVTVAQGRYLQVDLAIGSSDIPPRPTFGREISYYVQKITGYYRDHRSARRQPFLVPLLSCLADKPVEPCEKTANHTIRF